MPHGGTRVGSGRKARPSKREQSNDQFDVKAALALPELFETVYTIAKGYKLGVFEKPRKGDSKAMQTADGQEVFVYTVPPDKAAAMYLIDRAAGRAAVKSSEQTDTELTLEVTMSPVGASE